MKTDSLFVITISRQLGSGGAYIGQQLAKKLNIFYADREIIHKAAQQFSLLEEELELRDEKISSYWQSFIQSFAYGTPDTYIPPQVIPTDHTLFEAEKEIIERIAKERSAVIIGRCGSYILREHPNHLKIFIHSDITSRKNRIQKLYNVSEVAAEKMIIKSDKERSLYYYAFTGKDWIDARQYDISLDTGKISLDKSIELLIKCME
jgi:CMP/dCMP kinase